MSNIFNSVHSKRPPRNNFNLTHEILTSGRIGNLIPIQCDLAVPGQFLYQSADFLMRFAPLAGPAMVRMNVHFHTFFVPLRLCTPQNSENSTFQDFMLKFKDGKENLPVLPVLTCAGDDGVPEDQDISLPEYDPDLVNRMNYQEFSVGSLWDYFGLKTYERDNGDYMVFGDNWPKDGVSLMPFIAYQKIYDDWYRRDQIEKRVLLPRCLGEINLGDFDMHSGADDILPDDWADGVYEGIDPDNNGSDEVRNKAIHNLFKLRQRNYERDYLTSALPEPQFGDEVFLSDGALSVSPDVELMMQFSRLNMENFMIAKELGQNATSDRNVYIPSGSSFLSYDIPNSTKGQLFGIQGGNDIQSRITGQLTKFEGLQAPMITINQLRVGMQMQGFLEKINRGGTRFKEFSNIIYHVDVPDARLQRVEYIGGFKNPVTIGTVVQTSETTEDSALGSLAGRATSLGGNVLSKGKKLVWEHGYYITLMSVTPRTSYYGGIPRLFSLSDPIDYYIPDFDRLGEDAVYNRELFVDLFGYNGSAPKQDEIFGYEPMYAYLKSSTSTVTGEFRDTLSYLHASRRFDDYPTLSPEFIKCMPEDFDRLFAFENIEHTSNEHFYAQIVLKQIAKKPMSKYSTPLTLM